MDASVVFYRDILGLTPEIISPYWSSFQLGALRIGLHPTSSDQTAPLGIYGKGWFLGMEVEDVRALRARLEACGAVIKGEYHDVPGAVVLDFLDPDGNTLEAYQPGISSSDLA